MPWNGSGVFNRLYSWVADRDAGLDILADRMDQDSNDIAQGLMQCLTVNGETVPAANLPMNNHRITGAAAGVADGDYATVGQIKNGGGGLGSGYLPLTGGTVTGTLTQTGRAFFTNSAGISVTGELVGGAANFSGTVVAQNILNVNGTLNANSGVTVDGTLSCNAAAVVAGALNANGPLNANSTLNANGALIVSGSLTGAAATFSGTLSTSANLTVGTSASIGSTLNVSGAATLSSLSVSGSSTLHAVTGTTAAFSSTLSVSGTTTATGRITTGAGILPSTHGGQECGDAAAAWGTVSAFGFNTISDRAYKRDLEPLPPSLGLVGAIAPQRYRWGLPVAGRDGVHWGFVAQDVKAAMAAAGLDFAGHRTGGEGVESLDYNELLPVLWRAVQELTARLAALEAR